MVEKSNSMEPFQKKIGSRVHNLRNKNKEKLTNAKGISDRGRLTEKLIINRLRENPTKCQKHSYNLSAVVDKSFEGVLSFCEIGS